jgi:hypothetical protein
MFSPDTLNAGAALVHSVRAMDAVEQHSSS